VLPGRRGKRSFLARHAGLADNPGEVVDSSGNVIGRHSGFHNFTIGQRRGIGIGGGAPLYVLETDARDNRVVGALTRTLRADACGCATPTSAGPASAWTA